MTHRTSEQWEKVSFKSLTTLASASKKMPFILDTDTLASAENLKMASLSTGHVIEVLASDGQFYPATITNKTKKFLTVTYEGTKGLEHEVVRRNQYTTHWRVLAVTREQRWLVEAARLGRLAKVPAA